MWTEAQQGTVDEFHKLWYDSEVWKHRMRWRGHSCYKCPFDLWQYQQLIHEVRPEIIIELGTANGGSALFLADMLRLESLPGHIYTVDVEDWTRGGPAAPNLTYLAGRKSVDPELFAELSELVQTRLRGRALSLPPGTELPVLVIADSDHKAENVLAELQLYSPLVTEGSYFIVEDTNLNGHPVFPTWGDGPHEAVEEFLEQHPEFVRDPDCEALGLTCNPGGYLRKVALSRRPDDGPRAL